MRGGTTRVACDPIMVTAHLVGLILQREAPDVAAALWGGEGQVPIAQVIRRWIEQCFWNYLDWSEIRSYLALCFTQGADYQVYYCVAILMHLGAEIVRHKWSGESSLWAMLMQQPIRGFTVGGGGGSGSGEEGVGDVGGGGGGLGGPMSVRDRLAGLQRRYRELCVHTMARAVAGHEVSVPLALIVT